MKDSTDPKEGQISELYQRSKQLREVQRRINELEKRLLKLDQEDAVDLAITKTQATVNAVRFPRYLTILCIILVGLAIAVVPGLRDLLLLGLAIYILIVLAAFTFIGLAIIAVVSLSAFAAVLASFAVDVVRWLKKTTNP